MTSTQSPFLHATLLDGRGGGVKLDDAAVSGWTPADGVLWVHLDIHNPEARRWLLGAGGLDAVTAEALMASETRPRALASNDGVLVILRGVNMNPGADPEDMVSIRIWLESGRIITTRVRLLLSVEDLVAAIDEGRGPRTSGSLLVMLVDRIASRIGAVIDRIGGALEAVEQRLGAGKVYALRAELASLRRETASIRRYLGPQRDALNRLPGAAQFFTPEVNDGLREQSDRTMRYIEDLDLAREEAIVAQEELTNKLAQDQNARLYVLSIVAAVFLPLTFVTGLLGMNVAGLPGTENPLAFTVSVATMAAVTIALVLYFRFKKWI